MDWKNRSQSSSSLPSDFNIGNFLRNEKLLAAARKLDQSSQSSSESSPNESTSSSSSSTAAPNQICSVDFFVKFDYWSLNLEYVIWFAT